MGKENVLSIPVGFREEVDAMVQQIGARYVALIKESPDEVREHLTHARDHLQRQIPQTRPAICGGYLELAMVEKMRDRGLIGDAAMLGLSWGAYIIANSFYIVQGINSTLSIGLKDKDADPELKEFLDSLEREGEDKLNDRTGFALVDFIADDFLPRSVHLLEKHPDMKILILAGADLARKVYKEAFPLSEGMEPPPN